MNVILSLLVGVGALIADKLPKRIPIGTPGLSSGIEVTFAIRALAGRLFTAEQVALGVDDGNRRLIRHGNNRGNSETRLTRTMERGNLLVEKVEQFAGRNKWVDVGRQVTLFLGGRWTANLNAVGGSGSIWLTYFPAEGVSVAVGYDTGGGLLVLLRERETR